MNIDELKEISSNFQKELELSTNGHKTSLPFIINPIPTKHSVNDNEVFQVIVIGGSIFKSALLKKKKDKFEIVKLKEVILPQISTKDILLKFLEKYIDNNIKALTINFAFPIKPILRGACLDGILLQSVKGHKFEGLIGKQVGEEILRYFIKKNKKIKINIANDTICLLMSSLCNNSYEDVASGIVGTGVNFALFLSKNKAVNLETRCFNKFKQAETTQKLDIPELNKERDSFEIEVSGAYLYKHFNLLIKSQNINYPEIINSKELSIIFKQNIPQVSDIAKKILERSAMLISCVAAGITLYKKADLKFVMEGSLFWKGYNYKETVEQTVRKLVPEYKVKFMQIENSDILGAAKLLC